MTAYSSTCGECRTHVDWIDCPTGGWWSHRTHPTDNHDAQVIWRPRETMNDNGEWITL
jgi:hypothetical protein